MQKCYSILHSLVPSLCPTTLERTGAAKGGVHKGAPDPTPHPGPVPTPNAVSTEKHHEGCTSPAKALLAGRRPTYRLLVARARQHLKRPHVS